MDFGANGIWVWDWSWSGAVWGQISPADPENLADGEHLQ